MLPTPEYGRLPESVYEPAEDSFLLLDALEDEADSLRAMQPLVCVEIGSGSGVASSFLASLLPPASALILCTDINPSACLSTQHTAHLNSTPLSPLHTSLLSPLLPRLLSSINILLFNPPYVPTPTPEFLLAQSHAPDPTSAAWAGGDDGIGLLPSVLGNLEKWLAPGGRVYLVALKGNDPEGLVREYGVMGVRGEIIKHRRAGRESLFILKFTKGD